MGILLANELLNEEMLTSNQKEIFSENEVMEEITSDEIITIKEDVEIIFDYESRSRDIDNKLLQLRENLIERKEEKEKKGFFSFIKRKLLRLS